MKHRKRNRLLAATLRFRPGTPSSVASEIFEKYGCWLETDEETIEYSKTLVSKKIEARMSPGHWLKTLRKAQGLKQAQLGAIVGETTPVSASRICDWEKGSRAIPKEAAKKFSEVFKVPLEKFI